MTGYTDQLNAIWKKHDCHPVRGLLNVVVQAPLFISFFLSVQRLARADLPSMKTGGMLWFPDLSAADPMYALPIVSAAFFLATVELGAMDGAPNQQTNQMKNVMRILSVVIVPLTMKMPAVSASNQCSAWTEANPFLLLRRPSFSILCLRAFFL